MEQSEEFGEGFDSFSTDAIHTGVDPMQWSHRAVVPPITLATTYQIAEPTRGARFYYTRGNNPSRSCLEECLAALEGAKSAYCFASGMAATMTATHLLTSGDNVLCSADVYGGTFRYFKYCAVKMGISTTFVDFLDLDKLEAALDCKPKMVWFEEVTNPTLKITDMEAVVAVVRKKVPDALICVDNTFLTPYLLRPLDLGVDIVMHSITKYMNGHSDVLMGSLATNDANIAQQIKFFQMALGAVPSPFDCFMVQRGLKTLAIRLREHCSNAKVVAEYLENHPLIDKVLYPGLASHSQYSLAKRILRDNGGMVSFYVKGSGEQTKTFLKNLKIISLGFSLGGYESLAELPCTMTHGLMTDEARDAIGITNTLVRLSVGLENPTDLTGDLDSALKTAIL
ncbi:cystathionine gamma-lyase-like [Haliotis cracherodii]|uniref:cystathionine gamma-lyase-like n=1 Tax=Haliotis cracherodii TaxID=6455 RepID=UPI0039EABB4F